MTTPAPGSPPPDPAPSVLDETKLIVGAVGPAPLDVTTPTARKGGRRRAGDSRSSTNGSSSTATPGVPASGGAGPTPRGPGRPLNRTKRADKVTALYAQLGGMLLLGGIVDVRISRVGLAMTDHAGSLGQAWAEWAETSTVVAKAIDGLTYGGAAVVVLLAHVPLATAALSDSGPLDPDNPGAGIADLFAGLFATADTPPPAAA